MTRMEQLNPSDLKAILHSKRANVYYLEYCRVMQKDGRVLYLTEAKNENQYWNIGSLENWMNTTNLFNTVHCHVKKHRFQPNSLRALLVARVYFSFNQLNQISILLRCFKWYSSALDKRAACMFYDERSSISWFFHFDFSSEQIYLRSACSQRTISLSFSSKR